MSWLERSGETKRKKEKEEKRLAEAKEEHRQLEIKGKWGEVVRPAFRAINEWKRLELDRLLVDIGKSRLLGEHLSLESSDFKCIFLYGKDCKTVCQFGDHLRTGWRVNTSFTFEHKDPVYRSIEEALEAGSSSYTYTPKETSFSRVERSLYYAYHEGDGETWGTISQHEVFSLKIQADSLIADETNLGSLSSFRKRGDVESKLDNYIASKIKK